MDLESKRMELLEQFCLLAKSARGRAAVDLINRATSAPGLFAFGELLDMPSIQELQGSEHSGPHDLLRLFAHGTWADYKANAASMPPLEPCQILKLKQLTVMSLAENAKVLPYELLMEQLDVSNVRELEDLLINECMYTGIVRGKLDQRQRCFEVHFAAGRDLRPGQLDRMIQALSGWLQTSENLLLMIQEKIKWADNMSEIHRRHKSEVEAKADEVRTVIRADIDLRGQSELIFGDGGAASMDYVDEDRSRPKRRR